MSLYVLLALSSRNNCKNHIPCEKAGAPGDDRGPVVPGKAAMAVLSPAGTLGQAGTGKDRQGFSARSSEPEALTNKLWHIQQPCFRMFFLPAA